MQPCCFSPLAYRIHMRLLNGDACLLVYIGAMVYLLQSIAWSLPILFISKFPGLLLHCMIGAQASVTDLAEPGERAKAMGRLSLRYASLFTRARRILRGEVGLVVPGAWAAVYPAYRICPLDQLRHRHGCGLLSWWLDCRRVRTLLCGAVGGNVVCLDAAP